jgi:hypothetical protein
MPTTPQPHKEKNIMAWLTKLREESDAHAGADGHKPFLEQLRAVAEGALAEGEGDDWEHKLKRIKGRIGPDQIERVSTRDVFDHLDVPMKKRPGLTLRLSHVMRSLGWSNIRAWGLNDHSVLSRVRGFARPAPGSKALM